MSDGDKRAVKMITALNIVMLPAIIILICGVDTVVNSPVTKWVVILFFSGLVGYGISKRKREHDEMYEYYKKHKYDDDVKDRGSEE